jgi:hypothetical protein
VVVDPVDVDTVLGGSALVVESDCGTVSFTGTVDVEPGTGAVELGATEPVPVSEVVSDDGVSATARPAPLTTATPIPRATAKAPTRPTYAAAPI